MSEYQRYAAEFVRRQLGGRLLRNDLATFHGMPCGDFEYEDKLGRKGRKLTIAHHGTEHGMPFTASTWRTYAKLEPLIATIMQHGEIV